MMRTFLKLSCFLSLALALTAQTYHTASGKSYSTTLTSSGLTGAHSASTLFTAPGTGIYTVRWSLRTTTVASAGTINGLTFAWSNGSAMSRNTLLVGPQLLDLTSLTSTGLTGAEIDGTQTMYVTSGTAVTWATVVGTSITGSPQYTAEFRVFASN
jgi:hypothetical protein